MEHLDNPKITFRPSLAALEEDRQLIFSDIVLIYSVRRLTLRLIEAKADDNLLLFPFLYQYRSEGLYPGQRLSLRLQQRPLG